MVDESVPIEVASVSVPASDAASTTAAAHVSKPLIIEPRRPWPRLDFRELWRYRGLFFFLVWRDVKVRYAQTVLGAGWAILQPVLSMVVFTVIFGHFAGIPSDGVPYSVFALTALVAWTYFSTALSGASGSLVASTNLLTKVYFPRLVIPFAPVLAGLIDFAIGLLILLATMLVLGIVPGAAALVLVPALVVVMVLTAAGVGCWLAALNLKYRDIRHAVPFVVQIWMFASPIVYPMSIVPPAYRPYYALNPMAGVIEGFRFSLLGTGAVSGSTIGISALVASLLFISGAYYFKWTEDTFADVA